MYFNIEIPNIVHRDIDNFVNFAFNNSGSYEISVALKEILYAGIHSLNIFPNRCQEIQFGYRVLVVKGIYKIIYKVLEKEKKVVIIRIIRSESSLFDFMN